ncbi:MAG TPA: lipid IV(A) palmitoyltransferase PagP [Casimicrobiaceae bacterium]|nr:lipid IV(A) palmitoyltransferase PagP [Casimicrobiaceae bacterium]
MKVFLLRVARALCFASLLASASATEAFVPCDRLWSWLEYQCTGLKESWRDGESDLYLTGWTHHNRHTYTPEKIAEFNERAWGGGLGLSKYNDRGDAFGWYVLAFRDSHFKTTKMIGWSWRTFFPAHGDYAVGLGYTAFLGSRPDIYRGIPFPGILPLASIKLKRVELLGTYIPKVNPQTTGNGNVGFIFMRIHF